jgi:hypothetical protein
VRGSGPWLCRLVGIGGAVLGTACAPWPLGGRLDLSASGLAGEWSAPAQGGSPDSLVWWFRDDGTYRTLRLEASRAGGSVEPVARGWWQVYRDARGDPRPLVCVRRDQGSGGWPVCRHFLVGVVPDTTGQARRMLAWDDWIGEGRPTTTVLTERAP